MNHKQESVFTHLKQVQQDHRNDWLNYWLEYSNIHTWQFWVLLLLFILPLILVYFYIDKKKALLIGFYGYNVHVFYTYFDMIGTTEAFWGYPYKFLPLLASNFTLNVSLIPVTFMFMYQWVLNKQQNHYLYLVLLSAVLAFVFMPLLSYLNLVVLMKNTNYFYLFIGYIVIGVISKLITNFFIHLGKKAKN